jgi:predicted transcriptional regulator
MIRGERKRALIACLEEGPGTRSEIASELEWPGKLISAHLSRLQRLGLVRKTPYRNGRAKGCLWGLAA